MLKTIDFNIIFKNKRLYISLLVNVIIIFLYTFMVNGEYEYYVGWYFKNPFLLICFTLMIIGQSSFYGLYTNTYVINRFKSNVEVYKMIIMSDLIVALLFWLINVFGCMIVNFITSISVINSLPFFVLMFVWVFFCTCLKHFMFVLLENYNTASLIVIIILLIIKIVTDIFFSTYFSFCAIICSFMMLYYVLLEIKKDEYLIRGKNER